jgi:hypothetical protein
MPLLFIEAKAIEKDFTDRKWISQILGYATVVGLEWCVALSPFALPKRMDLTLYVWD